MKKLLIVMLGIMLLAAPLSVRADAEGASAADPVVFRKVWLSGPQYGYRADVTVLMLTNDPAWGSKTEAEIASEIRFVPFDADSGLFGPGEGEPAGERAEITSLADDRMCVMLRFREPGKYIISDAVYYFLNRSDPVQAGLCAELDRAVTAAGNAKETKVARNLHDWIAGRISPVFPEEDARRLDAVCGDPMNALITGYGREAAYDRLFDMLIGSAGLCGIRVSGLKETDKNEWCLSYLDGQWVWTDMSMDDLNDKKGNAYFAKDEKAFGKDHALEKADEAFVQQMVRTCAFDRILSEDLPCTLFHKNLTIGDWVFLINEGPAYVVGDSATVTFRGFANRNIEEDRKKSAEQFLEETVTWFPWEEENLWYDTYMSMDPDEEYAEKPPISEFVTVEEINEDKTRFTLTFHRPGYYELMYKGIAFENFYLISPEETTLAAMAAEMDEAVEQAKKAPTEKAAAQWLFQWVRRHVKYNHPAWDWQRGNPNRRLIPRDPKTAWEPFGALIYGKAVCVGYAKIYHMLMRQAGLTDFVTEGLTLPDNIGHTWNLNRLDGVWSFTDATWNRFNWTAARMNKDHDPHFDSFHRELVFGEAMSYLAKQTRGESAPLSAIPIQLKYLPKTADGYGFPEKPGPFMDISMELEKKNLKLKLGQKARVILNYSRDGRGNPLSDWERRTPVTANYKGRVSYADFFQIELRTDPDLPFVKKASSQWILVNVEDGQIVKTMRRTVVPDKAGTYAGYNPRYHYYEYDEEMRPSAAGWYMVSPSRNSLEFRVFFDQQGNALRYEARYKSEFDKIESVWEGTPENELTVFNGTPVENPAEISPRLWEPVWFE